MIYISPLKVFYIQTLIGFFAIMKYLDLLIATLS